MIKRLAKLNASAFTWCRDGKHLLVFGAGPSGAHLQEVDLALGGIGFNAFFGALYPVPTFALRW